MTEREIRKALKEKIKNRRLGGKISECPLCFSKRTQICTPASKGIIRCKNCGYVAKRAQWKEEYRARKAGFKTKDLDGDFK